MGLHSTMAIFTFLNSHRRMHSISPSSSYTTSAVQSYLNYTDADRKFALCGYREQRYGVNSINPSKTKKGFFTVNNNAARMQYLLSQEIKMNSIISIGEGE